MYNLQQKRIFALMMTFVLMLSLVVGCTAQEGESVQTKTPQKPRSIQYPIHLTDQANHKITIESEPKRIVSLIPSTTEIAFALDLKNEVVGVTANDDYPEAVKDLPKVGDFTINTEQVVALKPDLVLASNLNSKETIDQLGNLGLKVIVTDAKSIKDVYQSINVIAQATNRKKEADELVKQMEDKKREIFTKVHQIAPQEKNRKQVWIEIDPTLYTAGGGTLLNELLTIAGGENVAEQEQGWPQISAEQVVKWNPDVIFSTYGSDKEIYSRKGWNAITAVKNKQVHVIDPNLVNRPGPRLVEGLERMAQALYPEHFQATQ
ncbi:ABC transporter substrate-binding protein [Hazenella sp. IB182357]|uniref:ABC transporter substrate-binding protein n=1 Tax=Polycladospora coralii TaxID=2771432 RepID=A0A926RSA0_9BACL|nr:ABC transporter substrate-binding protein [Polycladospora coralii]MBD1370800.1 ABC transporter substrate-binding protein [Polycladospora coralii]